MKLNKIITIFFLTGAVILSFVAVKALADISDVQYPVSQLGNCKNETECRNYCDKPENTSACLNFAEQNNLMPKEEIEMAKKFATVGNKGPGGCTGKDSCETYCNDISHIDECVSFAEQNNLMPPEELREAQKVRDAIRRGVKPPACGSKKSCDSYCEDPSHMEECITFASEAGFMGDKEKEDAQKMLSAIKKGVRPPNCRGKEECDSYCQSDEHFEECANFAEATGFMNAKDAEMARKTKGKGPGGCKDKEECEAFCNNKDNQEICFKFAEDNGMIPEEELKKMKEGMSQMRGQEQEGVPPQESGEFRRGPGGCSTPEECQIYCSQNPEACRNFQGPGNEQRGGEEPREWNREEFQNKQMPPEFQRPPQEFNQSGTPIQPVGGEVIPPQPRFEGQPSPNGQFRPSEPVLPMPQIQQEPQVEMAPPPLPPSEPIEPAPQSLLNNKYLGAIFRFLISD